MDFVFDSIAVALDRSEASAAALEIAAKIAVAQHARVVLINVLDLAKLVSASGYQTPYPQEALEALRSDGDALFKSATASLEAKGIAVTTEFAEGDPCDEIIRIASDKKCGLIAIVTHGRSGITRMFLGSIAEGVLRRSSVPVLVTPTPGAHAHATR